jgi:hypothetical protein
VQDDINHHEVNQIFEIYGEGDYGIFLDYHVAIINVFLEFFVRLTAIDEPIDTFISKK